MFAITLALLVCQHLSATWSTRLPLEVYELTPPVAATATLAATATAQQNDLHYLQQQQQQQQEQHKNLKYSTINAKQQQNFTKTTIEILSDVADNVAATATATATSTTTTKSNSQQLDRRRSRQMLDIMQQQQHRFDHAAMQHHLHHSNHQQQQQQQHQQNTKDVRILYQVGESEDDLPICAANAVCSKIDLYETPWIERQCRCPDVNRITNTVIHHHSSNSNSNSNNNNNNKEPLEITSYSHILDVGDKYRNYYEKEKLLQHKRLLVSDFGDKRFESLHMKKLMQKLGAVYQDDLDLQPSDFLETNEDGGGGAIGSHDEFDLDEINENEFPHLPRRNERLPVHQQHMSATASGNAAHMRHSGHSNRAKELSYIGGCPSGLGIEDGHTIADKTRHYKLCSPVHKLPVCKHFREYTWTLTTSAELNVTEQIVHCRCPKNSVTYLTKREATTNGSGGFAYFFACSPLTRIRCQRKQPCKLFTVRKRQEFLDEVNINALCQCPKGHHCPGHHTQSGVIPGESFLEDNIQTYSGYCMAND